MDRGWHQAKRQKGGAEQRTPPAAGSARKQPRQQQQQPQHQQQGDGRLSRTPTPPAPATAARHANPPAQGWGAAAALGAPLSPAAPAVVAATVQAQVAVSEGSGAAVQPAVGGRRPRAVQQAAEPDPLVAEVGVTWQLHAIHATTRAVELQTA
jgi:hypothetical protein